MGLFNWIKKNKDKEQAPEQERPLDSGLEKTKRSLFEKLSYAIAGKSVVDDEVLDSLEEVLIASDVGVETTQNIIERLEARVARDKYLNTDEVNRYLCEEIIALLDEAADGSIVTLTLRAADDAPESLGNATVKAEFSAEDKQKKMRKLGAFHLPAFRIEVKK